MASDTPPVEEYGYGREPWAAERDEPFLGWLAWFLRACGFVVAACGRVAEGLIAVAVDPSRAWARWLVWRDRHVPKPAVWDPAEARSPHLFAYRPTTADIALPACLTRLDLYAAALWLGRLREWRWESWQWRPAFSLGALGPMAEDFVRQAAMWLGRFTTAAGSAFTTATTRRVGAAAPFRPVGRDRFVNASGVDGWWLAGCASGLTALLLIALLFREGVVGTFVAETDPPPADAPPATAAVADTFGGLPPVREVAPPVPDEPLPVELAADPPSASLAVVAAESDVVTEPPTPPTPEIDRLVTRAVRAFDGSPLGDDWLAAAEPFGMRRPRATPSLRRVGFDDAVAPLAPLPGPSELKSAVTEGSRDVRVTVTRREAGAAVAGRPHTYELLVRNDGAAAVDGFAVAERLGAGAELIETDPPARVTEDTLSWRLDRLAAGESRTLSVTVLIEEPAAPLVAAAAVRSVVSAGAATDAVAGRLRLVLTLPERVAAGGVCPTRLTVLNSGAVPLDGVTLRGELPAGLVGEDGRGGLAFMVGKLAAGERASRDLEWRVAEDVSVEQVGGSLRAASAEGVVEDLDWSVAITAPRPREVREARSAPRPSRRFVCIAPPVFVASPLPVATVGVPLAF